MVVAFLLSAHCGIQPHPGGLDHEERGAKLNYSGILIFTIVDAFVCEEETGTNAGIE